MSPRGAITSFVDKRLGNREFAGLSSGYALNDLGASTGTLRIENAGSVSVTLVAGIYGMNFTYMPELSARYGYVWALTAMLVIALVLYFYFKRIKWL